MPENTRPPDLPPPADPQWGLREYGLSDFDEVSAQIPVWDWISGAGARRAAAQARREADRANRAWGWLLDSAPSIEQLTPDYRGEEYADEYGNLIGGPSAFAGTIGNLPGTTLDALGRMARGEITAGDRAHMRLATQEQQRLLRGQNDAITQQMSARGMLGSGADLATRLAGSEAALGAQSSQQQQMLAQAQQRALGALQAQGQLGVAQTGLDLQRRQALDAYNQRQLDWRRGVNQRSTEWANRTAEARANATQQAQQNRERGVAGMTGQYNTNQQGARQDAAAQAQQSASLTGAVGELIKELI